MFKRRTSFHSNCSIHFRYSFLRLYQFSIAWEWFIYIPLFFYLLLWYLFPLSWLLAMKYFPSIGFWDDIVMISSLEALGVHACFMIVCIACSQNASTFVLNNVFLIHFIVRKVFYETNSKENLWPSGRVSKVALEYSSIVNIMHDELIHRKKAKDT